VLLVWVVPPPLLLVSDPESRRLSGGVVLRLFFVATLEAAALWLSHTDSYAT
jgi:hypothetical protein